MDVDRNVLFVHPRELKRRTHKVLLLVLADVNSEIFGEYGGTGSAARLKWARSGLPRVKNVQLAAQQLSMPWPSPLRSTSNSVVEKAIEVGEE